MSRQMVSTETAREMLKARGFTVPYPTLARWVRDGKFPGAQLEETPRGPVWLIPASAVERFEPPKKGRPTKAKENGNATGAKRAGKKKGGKR